MLSHTRLGNTQALWEFTLSLTLVIYRMYTHTMGLSDGSDGKEPACNAGDLSSVPGLGRFPGEGKGYPFQYSGLENFMDYNPWGHKESDTTERLSHVSPPFYTMHSMWLLVFIAMLGMTLL